DKLDTVAGLSRAGERATGSRDPFGLRRQMHGIVRILMDLPELTGIDREVGAAVAFAQERVRYALEQRALPVEVVRGATAHGSDAVPLRARRVAAALQG